MATTPQKLAGYETVFITRPEMAEDQLKALNERLTNAIKGFTGEIILTEDWGSRKLAYKIQKESRGRYGYIVYTGAGNVVAEVERNLRLNEHVLRFLSVNLAKEFEQEAFMKHREELKAQAKRRQEEYEARKREREAKRAAVIVDDSDDGDDE